MSYCSICQCLDPGYVSYSSGSYGSSGSYDYGSSGSYGSYGSSGSYDYGSSGSYATYDYGSSGSCQDAWIGDGYCDDDNNCSTCQYDGGDCCGDNVQTIYCSDCQCLDPSYYGRNE